MEVFEEPTLRRERQRPPANCTVSDLEQLPSIKHLPPLTPHSSSSKGYSAEECTPVPPLTSRYESTKNVEPPERRISLSKNQVRDVPPSVTTKAENEKLPNNKSGLLPGRRSSLSLHENALQGSKTGKTDGTSQDNINLFNGLSVSSQKLESTRQLPPLISPTTSLTAKSLRQRFTGGLGSARAVQDASHTTRQSVTKIRFQDGLVRLIEKNYYEAYTEAVHESLEEKWEQSIHNKLHKAVNAVLQGIGLQPPEMFMSLALLMVGRKVGDMLHLLPTVVISCCHKTAKTKIEDLVSSNQLDYLSEFACPYLVCCEEREPKRRDRFFADTDSWEVLESTGAIPSYDLSRQRQEYMSFEIEKPTDFNSACGMQVNFTYMPPSTKSEHGSSGHGCWRARIGGVIQVGGKNFAMTTAHSFLMPTTDESSDASIGSTSIVDGASATNADEPGHEATGKEQQKQPSKTFARGALQGSFAFCGHGRSFDLQEQTLLTISNADCCILPMNSLSGLTNHYRARDLKGQSVDLIVNNMLEPGEKLKPGVVRILDNPEMPMESFLTQTTASVYFGGKSLRVRRIVSQQPLPSQLSGCWVVRDNHLLGHLIGGNEFERIMYMIPIQDTRSAIDQITSGSMSLDLASDFDLSEEVRNTHVIRIEGGHRESPKSSGLAKPLPLLPRLLSSTTPPLVIHRDTLPRLAGRRSDKQSLLPVFSTAASTEQPVHPNLNFKRESSHGSNVWYEDPETGELYQEHFEKGITIRVFGMLVKEGSSSRDDLSKTIREQTQSSWKRPAEKSTGLRQREKSTTRETARGYERSSYTESDRTQPSPEGSARYADESSEAHFTPSIQASTSYQPPMASGRPQETTFLSSNQDHFKPIYASHDYGDEGVPAAAQIPLQESIQLNRVVQGTPRLSETVDSSYKVRSRDYKTFFRIGRVFSTLWTDSLGNNAGKVDPTFVSEVIYGERVYSKIRRFIVVREGERSVSCLPVTSYANEGFRKSGIQLDEHGFIYSRNKPKRIEGMCSQPIRLNLAQGAAHLKDPSLINYGKVYNVETNVKVKNVGSLDSDSEAVLLHYFRKIYSGIVDPSAAGITPRASEAVLLGVRDSYPAPIPAASYTPATASESGFTSAPTVTGYPPAAPTAYGASGNFGPRDPPSAYYPPSSQYEDSSSMSSRPTSKTRGMGSDVYADPSIYPSMHSQTQYAGAPLATSSHGLTYTSENAMDPSRRSSGSFYQAPPRDNYCPPQLPSNTSYSGSGFYQQQRSNYPATSAGSDYFLQPASSYGQAPEHYPRQDAYVPQQSEAQALSSASYDDEIDLPSPDPEREAAIAKRRRR